MHPDDLPPEPPPGTLIARPERRYATGRGTVWVRRGALILTALTVVGSLLAYPALPDAIPTHFDNAGRADGYGPKPTLLVVLAALALMVVLLAIASHVPRLFTYPVPLTEENAQRLYRAGEQMIGWKTGIVAVMLLGLALAVLIRLPILVFAIAGLVSLVVSLIVGIVRMVRV
ncbi:DUF1648 domain-containing protein [Leucobacter japonicus]|uniref:DUF1648 domain-containing protein n=1 Tax=Leucobacter japonicus TaxID=1461259 RepID=UPI0006A79E70|nr:DUF1648 domain-containing protein [Leucobacter japonicus]